MQYETIVKYIIGILVFVVVVYMMYMFFTQAGGNTKWTLYQDDSGTIPYVSEIVKNYQCMATIEGCASTGGGAAFEQCNGIKLANTCNIFCEKYCKEKNQNATCGDSWTHLKSNLCRKDNLYAVTITKQTTDGKTEIVDTQKNKNEDKLNILSFDKAIEVKSGENITVSLAAGVDNLNFDGCYAIYLSDASALNIIKLPTDITTPGKYLISTSCLLNYSSNFMDKLCSCT